MSLNCHVCFTIHPVSDFKFFLCGHGFCVTCIDGILSHNPLCPHCRVRVRRGDAHPVYLDVLTTKEQEELSFDPLIQTLTEIGPDSDSRRVTEAADRIQKSADMFRGSENIMAILLKSLEDFGNRIIPVFKRAEEQHSHIQALKKAQAKREFELKAGKRRVELLEGEIAELRRSMHNMKEDRDHAIHLAHEASNETVQLREDLNLSRELTSVVEEKNRRYKSQLLAHSVAARKRKERIKLLEYDLAHVPAQHPEDDMEGEHQFESTNRDNLDLKLETPFKVSGTIPLTNSVNVSSPKFEYEGMPPNSFRSDWQLPNTRKKRKRSSEYISDDFPIRLDEKGHSIGAVHTGIKRMLRVAPLRQARS